MSYKKALKKLEALPKGEQQLAGGRYVWQVKNGKSHCGCAIGKLLTERQRVRLFPRNINKAGVDDLVSCFLGSAAVPEMYEERVASQTGLADLTFSEASALQVANDDFGRDPERPCTNVNDYKTRKARYKSVLEWLRSRVAKE